MFIAKQKDKQKNKTAEFPSEKGSVTVPNPVKPYEINSGRM